MESSSALLLLVYKEHLSHFLILNPRIEQPPIEYHDDLMSACVSLASLEIGAKEHLTLLALQIAFCVEFVHLLAELDHDVHLR